MAKYTEHLRLVKPEGNEYYNVEQFNQNAELIDKETKKLSEDLAKVQEGATREKAGIVQLGTGEGKALEGIMLARMFGCVGYGGDIQEPGVKDINYIYYDRNTRKMYKCLNQNSDVSANVANFIPLDNNSLLEKLDNLPRIGLSLIYVGYINLLIDPVLHIPIPENVKKVLVYEDWYANLPRTNGYFGYKIVDIDTFKKEGIKIAGQTQYYCDESGFLRTKGIAGDWSNDMCLIYFEF